MKKIKLEIIGLSFSQTQSGAYALVLGEEIGKRRLPIIIGGFEAQAIAVELENMKPNRPLTHDLFKNFAESFSIDVKEVIVYNLKEGIFYAKLVCTDGNKTYEIDARTSDAIAMAVRFNCPIYTYEFILSQAGINLDESTATLEEGKVPVVETGTAKKIDTSELTSLTDDELQESLLRAIDDEAYEMASKIRDELKRRQQSQ